MGETDAAASKATGSGTIPAAGTAFSVASGGQSVGGGAVSAVKTSAASFASSGARLAAAVSKATVVPARARAGLPTGDDASSPWPFTVTVVALRQVRSTTRTWRPWPVSLPDGAPTTATVRPSALSAGRSGAAATGVLGETTGSSVAAARSATYTVSVPAGRDSGPVPVRSAADVKATAAPSLRRAGRWLSAGAGSAPAPGLLTRRNVAAAASATKTSATVSASSSVRSSALDVKATTVPSPLIAGSVLAPVASARPVPGSGTLTLVTARVEASQRKTSGAPFASSATRLDAVDSKAMRLPSALTAGALLAPSASPVPPDFSLTRTVSPLAVSKRNTSAAPFASLATMLAASDT